MSNIRAFRCFRAVRCSSSAFFSSLLVGFGVVWIPLLNLTMADGRVNELQRASIIEVLSRFVDIGGQEVHRYSLDPTLCRDLYMSYPRCVTNDRLGRLNAAKLPFIHHGVDTSCARQWLSLRL